LLQASQPISLAQTTLISPATAVQAAVAAQPNSSSAVDNSIVDNNTSTAALPAHIVEWMTSMSTAMQQLQLKVDVSEAKCQGFDALEARVQALETSNTELRQQNTQLQRRLDDTETKRKVLQKQNEDLEVRLSVHIEEVLCSYTDLCI
jgi:uncharacterized protein YlxW (UPF0749 family)